MTEQQDISRNASGQWQEGHIPWSKGRTDLVAWNKGRLEPPNEYDTIGDIVIMIITDRYGQPKRLVQVDKAVHEKIKQYRWTVYGKYPNNDYVWRNDFGPLHRHVLGLKTGDKSSVDHINRDRFDCRLCNLRIADQLINARNHSTFKTSTTGVNGVSYSPKERGNKKYVVTINHHGKQWKVGRYHTLEAAIAARQAAEQQHWNNNEVTT